MTSTGPLKARGAAKSLLPREHGAYAQLIFPLLTGLATVIPTPAGIGFAASAVVLFLAHEPLAVLTGARGPRRAAEAGAQAFRRAVVLGAAGVATGLLALGLANSTARLATAIPLIGALIVASLAFSGKLKTIAGEVLVGTTLAAMVLPVATASGAPFERAAMSVAVWAASFAMATISVHAVIARIKQQSPRRWTLVATPLVATIFVGGAFVLAGTGRIPQLAALAVIPSALVATGAALFGVHPRRLRTIGWSLVTANLVTFVLLLAAMRTRAL